MEIDHQTLFLAAKALAYAPRQTWLEPRPNYLTVVVPLDIGGITIEGLRFKAVAFKNMPEEAVTFQLEYYDPRRRGGAMSRIEWRPIKGHTNKNCGPAELRNVPITGSHIHPFPDNWAHSAGEVRKGGLPIAIPILEPLQTFEDSIDFAAKAFNLSGLEFVRRPQWELPLL